MEPESAMGKPALGGQDTGEVAETMEKVQAGLAAKVTTIMATCEAQLAEVCAVALQDLQRSFMTLQAHDWPDRRVGVSTPLTNSQYQFEIAQVSEHPGDLVRPRKETSKDTVVSTLTHKTLEEWKHQLHAQEATDAMSCFMSGRWIKHEGVGRRTFVGRVAHAMAAWDSWLDYYHWEVLAVEYFFTGAFLIEVLIKVHVLGIGAFWPNTSDGRYNFVDLVIAIVPGVLLTWVLPLVAVLLGFDSAQSTRILTLLRVARVARLARILYRVPIFKDAWILIRGLGDSLPTLMWTCVVITLTTYLFAIVGVFAITQPLQRQRAALLATDPEQAEALAEVIHLFDGLDKFMFTLCEVLTVDSANDLLRSVQAYLGYSWIFFFAYFCVATLALMNLVTAIIVDTAVKTNNEDRETQAREKKAEKEKHLAQMKEIWCRLDTDMTGTISHEEFKTGFRDDDIARLFETLDLKPDECEELFRILACGDNEIDPDEFFTGLGKLMPAAAQVKDIFKLEKQIGELAKSVKALRDADAFSL